MSIANAAHCSMMEGGGAKVPTAKDYMMQALLGLQYDGIENAGYGTHDSNATTRWVDLVAGSDATGSVDEITDIGPRMNSGTKWLSFTTPLTTSSRAWTMELCFLTTTHSGYWVIYASSEYGQGGSRFQYNIEGDMRLHFIPGGAVNTLSTGITNDALKNGTMAVTWNGSLLKMYWNGIYKSQIAMSAAQWTNTLTSRVCTLFLRSRLAYGDHIEPFWGTICAHRIYTAELPATDIAANYAIDKIRFGLP